MVMRFLLYSNPGDEHLGGRAGRPEYDYDVLRDLFRPLLEKIGPVEVVQNPHRQADPAFDRCRDRGEDCFLLCFCSPAKIPTGLRCPIVAVFAWAYPDLPGEVRRKLTQCIGAIVLSGFALHAARVALGPEFPIAAILPPLARPLAEAALPGGRKEIVFHGVVIDSQAVAFSADLLAPPVRPMARKSSPRTAGRIRRLAEQARERFREFTAGFRRRPQRQTAANAHAQKIALDGIVYAAVIDPINVQKNWLDMVTAFCWAFRDVADATLVLRTMPGDFEDFPHRFMRALSQLAPFRCRVVSVEAAFDHAARAQLADAADYYVNTSECEGVCLPLMEFMARGKPAIAPLHTALEECIDADSAFLAACSRQPAAFPHRRDKTFATDTYRLNWESLLAAFHESYRAAKEHPARYAAMAQAARTRIQRIASAETAENHLKSFFAAGQDRLQAKPARVGAAE